jgi:hypothetical protein
MGQGGLSPAFLKTKHLKTSSSLNYSAIFIVLQWALKMGWG